MKKCSISLIKSFFIFSTLIIVLGSGIQIHAAESRNTDKIINSAEPQSSDTELKTLNGATDVESSISSSDNISNQGSSSESVTTSSIQDSQTTLWDIEEENNVKYDKDLSTESSTTVREGMSTEELYSIGVNLGVINSETFSFDSWFQLEASFLWPSYLDIKQEGLLESSIGYQQWLIDNNFGLVIGNNSLFEIVRQERSTADNKRNFVNTIKKGDFVVVSDVREPWAPYIGHAAIATTDNWILDMPGFKEGTYTKEDNNRQLKKGDWFDKYQTAWTTVYRVRTTQSIRNDIADWADWRYWSSSHGLQKIDMLLIH